MPLCLLRVLTSKSIGCGPFVDIQWKLMPLTINPPILILITGAVLWYESSGGCPLKSFQCHLRASCAPHTAAVHRRRHKTRTLLCHYRQLRVYVTWRTTIWLGPSNRKGTFNFDKALNLDVGHRYRQEAVNFICLHWIETRLMLFRRMQFKFADGISDVQITKMRAACPLWLLLAAPSIFNKTRISTILVTHGKDMFGCRCFCQ